MKGKFVYLNKHISIMLFGIKFWKIHNKKKLNYTLGNKVKDLDVNFIWAIVQEKEIEIMVDWSQNDFIDLSIYLIDVSYWSSLN